MKWGPHGGEIKSTPLKILLNTHNYGPPCVSKGALYALSQSDQSHKKLWANKWQRGPNAEGNREHPLEYRNGRLAAFQGL